jgi:TM2 domain-containing membrane protein YozV
MNTKIVVVGAGYFSVFPGITISKLHRFILPDFKRLD